MASATPLFCLDKADRSPFREQILREGCTGKRSGSTGNLSGWTEGFPAQPEGFPVTKYCVKIRPEGFPVQSEGFPVEQEGFPALPEALLVQPEAFPALRETFPVQREGYPVQARRRRGDELWCVECRENPKIPREERCRIARTTEKRRMVPGSTCLRSRSSFPSAFVPHSFQVALVFWRARSQSEGTQVPPDAGDREADGGEDERDAGSERGTVGMTSRSPGSESRTPGSGRSSERPMADSWRLPGSGGQAQEGRRGRRLSAGQLPSASAVRSGLSPIRDTGSTDRQMPRPDRCANRSMVEVCLVDRSSRAGGLATLLDHVVEELGSHLERPG